MKPIVSYVPSVVKKINITEDLIQLFGKFFGLAWLLSNVPLIFGASITGELGRIFSDYLSKVFENIYLGYYVAEFVFLVVSILFVFGMLYLYRKQPTKFGKFLVTFCALVSVGIIMSIIGHLLSGNEILFRNSFS